MKTLKEWKSTDGRFAIREVVDVNDFGEDYGLHRFLLLGPDGAHEKGIETADLKQVHALVQKVMNG